MGDKSDIQNVGQALEEIGDAIVTAINYRRFPMEELDRVIGVIDQLTSHPEHISQVESHFRSSGSNYVLFYLSNILYNLKTKQQLHLTPDVLKWLGSVWKNFLNRNKNYQNYIPLHDQFNDKISEYYPGSGTFVNQIENAHLVKQEYIDKEDSDNELIMLEDFYRFASEILTAMRPTYFFLMDFYYERRLATGEDMDEAVLLEKKGLGGFGESIYTYENIAVLTCQCLGVLEAVYLILKKKTTTKSIININGKQKFMAPSEIYNFYLDKFNSMKKEIVSLNK